MTYGSESSPFGIYKGFKKACCYWRNLVFGVIVILSFCVPVTSNSSADSDIFKEKCHANYYTNPKCIDHPDGYGCECGSGFHWNTEMCMSTAIDSRLEFKNRTPTRYTLLLGKAFPTLEEFTIVFWIRINKNSTNGTILSYKYGPKTKIFYNLFRATVASEYQLVFELWGKTVKTGIHFKIQKWSHVAWTWNSTDGKWKMYWNAKLVLQGKDQTFRKPIPGGGELVLGQSSRKSFKFNDATAFVGDLAHLHIWNFVMSLENITAINVSCNFMYCGNVAQWGDFRSGTRGAMRMRWPSGIIESLMTKKIEIMVKRTKGDRKKRLSGKVCFTDDEMDYTCNKWCSDTIGAQCNKDIVENIVWHRTKANVYLNVSCPGQEKMAAMNETVENATRLCSKTVHNDGIWETPYIDKCISKELMSLKATIQQSLESAYVEESTILNLADMLYNHTGRNVYTNPIDVATVIDLLEMIVNQQDELVVLQLKERQWREGRHVYATAEEVFPTLEETQHFSKVIINTTDNLLSRKNDVGWNATKPPGVEGDNLLKVLETFSRTMAKCLEYHVLGGGVDHKKASLLHVEDHVEFKVEVYPTDKFRGYRFPAGKDRKVAAMSASYGEITVPDILKFQNLSTMPDFLQITSFRFKELAIHLPNHDRQTRSKENHVNTAIVALYVYAGDSPFVNNLTSPIIFKLPFRDTFNISNPECVRINHGEINSTQKVRWRWVRDDCQLHRDNVRSAVCGCYVPGIFAITTDMYNVNWDKGEKRPILMNAASYLGCAVSVLMCLATLAIHIYCKTSSSVASLHKNLAVSICFSQLAFMFGINRYEHKLVCQAFAVLIHYFLLATYSWLMNEAFNLYTTVTYSAHVGHSDLSDSGSLLRYNILGWIIPGVLVGAFVGSQGQTYYAKDMCWIAWDNLWLFIGPTLGIVAVTIMVLIFTAKEHNENSYTKSEKTNKILTVHMKGLWTQVILVTVNWSFAFLSLKMHDSIIKYLYAMMNVLQAAFFFVFNLLHEEIREVLKASEKKTGLNVQGLDNDQDDRSVDSYSSPLVEKDLKEAFPMERRRNRRNRPREKKTKIEASSDDEGHDRDGSDCEMITSL